MTFLNETWALIELWYFTWILIFLVIRPFLGYHYFFDTVTLTLGLSDISENFNLADNIWTVSDRTLIFHMSIPCDKIFLLVLNLLTMIFYQFWYWHYSWKNKILKLPYCAWSFLVTRSFYWYKKKLFLRSWHRWNWPLSGALCFTNISC